MRKLVLRLLLFALLYVVAGHVVKSMMPYYWGNPWWRAKMKILDHMGQKPSVYFIGSSRTYRHIIPTVFDSILASSGTNLRSFNLGAPATFSPQTYYLLEHAIAQKDIPNGSTVFLEYKNIQAIEAGIESTARSTYWVNWKELAYVAKDHIHCRSRCDSNSFFWPYLRAYLKNMFHIGQFKGLIGEYESQYEELDRINSAGFLSLSKESTQYPPRGVQFKPRIDEFLSDTLVADRRKSGGLMMRSSTIVSPCSALLSRLTELNDLCQTHNIDLIHLLPPTVMARSEWATFQALPANQRLDMGDPRAYPEFYHVVNLFDKGHLNEQGAILYTHGLAKEYVRLRPQHSE